jgi:hypothetical protein
MGEQVTGTAVEGSHKVMAPGIRRSYQAPGSSRSWATGNRRPARPEASWRRVRHASGVRSGCASGGQALVRSVYRVRVQVSGRGQVRCAVRRQVRSGVRSGQAGWCGQAVRRVRCVCASGQVRAQAAPVRCVMRQVTGTVSGSQVSGGQVRRRCHASGHGNSVSASGHVR